MKWKRQADGRLAKLVEVNTSKEYDRVSNEMSTIIDGSLIFGKSNPEC